MKKLVYILIASILIPTTLFGQYSTNSSDGSWSNPATWDANGMPQNSAPNHITVSKKNGSNTKILFDNPNAPTLLSATVSMHYGATQYDFTIEDQVNFTLDDYVDLTLVGLNDFTIENGADLTIPENSSLIFESGGDLAHQGTMNISGDVVIDGDFTVGKGTEISLSAGSSLEITGDLNFEGSGNGAAPLFTGDGGSLTVGGNIDEAINVDLFDGGTGVILNGGNGITVSAISNNTSENETTGTFTIELEAPPTADVTITLTSSNTNEGTVSPASITFTTANWDTPKTITVIGVDDSPASIDGDQTYTIVTGDCSSSDLNYNGRTVEDVTVINIDNDGPTSWIGSTSNDWNTISNWTNGVPDNSTSANINSGNPVISGGNFEIIDLTIASGASLTISPDASLTVNGDLTNATATLTLQADASGTANLITEGTVAGSIIQEVYHPAGRWSDVTVPLVSTTNKMNYSYSYDEAVNNFWVGFTGFGPSNWTKVPASETIGSSDVFRSYETTNRTLQYEGVPQNSDVTVSYTNTPNVTGANDYDSNLSDDDFNGWNFFPNPFPCGLDWNSVTVPGTLGDVISLREAGRYVYFKHGSATPWAPPGETAATSSIIPSTQGFWAQATGNGDLTLNKSARAISTNPKYKKAETAIEETLIVSIEKDGEYDITSVYFEEDADLSFNFKKDALKRYNPSKSIPNIFTYSSNNKELAINTTNIEKTSKIHIGTFNAKPGTCKVTIQKLPSSGSYFLEDLKTGEIIDIYEGKSINVYIAELEKERFVLHLSSSITSTEYFNSSDVSIFAHSNTIIIEGNRISNGTVTIYDLSGRVIANKNISGTKNTIAIDKKGIFIVKLTNSNQITTEKVFVN